MKDELKKGDSLYTDQSQAKNDDHELEVFGDNLSFFDETTFFPQNLC